MREGDVVNFSYTGSVQPYTIESSGIYKLEVWGAKAPNLSSGDGQIGYGGKGGYSVGYKKFKHNQVIYVACGGMGKVYVNPSGLAEGGFNGGGYGSRGSRNVCGGGGATHIATANGVLSSLENNRQAILIVAGGGGGSLTRWDDDTHCFGGAGGGLTGGDGLNNGGSGATQTSGGRGDRNYGTFGQGGANSSSSAVQSCTGGGGGYYGGGDGYSSSGGGGGSGYIGGVPSFTKSGVTYSPSTTSGQNDGNGYAKLTLVKKNASKYGNKDMTIYYGNKEVSLHYGNKDM